MTSFHFFFGALFIACGVLRTLGPTLRGDCLLFDDVLVPHQALLPHFDLDHDCLHHGPKIFIPQPIPTAPADHPHFSRVLLPLLRLTQGRWKLRRAVVRQEVMSDYCSLPLGDLEHLRSPSIPVNSLHLSQSAFIRKTVWSTLPSPYTRSPPR